MNWQRTSMAKTCIVCSLVVTLTFLYYNSLDLRLISSYRGVYGYLINASEQYTNISGVNQYVQVVTPTRKIHTFLIGSLRTVERPLVIYVYNRKDMISNSILQYGSWDSWLVTRFITYLKAHPGTQVLDIGCNIGVYTLTAAALGTRVVAIDANQNNTERVAQSLLDNRLTDNVSVLLNAVTNTRKEFIMTSNVNNIGSQNILESATDPRRVKAIFINDLIPLFDGRRPVIIKIDIEGREIEALQAANEFFDKIDVKLVVMEWEWIKVMKDINFVLDFFTKRGYRPFNGFPGSTSLGNIDRYISWPGDIVWIKEKEMW